VPKHLKGGETKINKGFYEGEEKKYASQDMMVVAQNNGLEF
jgi:hypothetical protein